MPGLFKNAICYKYTFPLGMINNLISMSGFDFCTDDVTDTSLKDIEDVNQAVSNLLTDSNIIEDQTQSISQTVTVNPAPDQHPDYPDYPEDHVMPLEVEYGMDGDGEWSFLTKQKEGKNLFDPTKCSPQITQTATQISKVNEEISETNSKDIIDTIEEHAKEVMKKAGASDEDLRIFTQDNISNHSQMVDELKVKTNSVIQQYQSSAQNITYIDNYGVCGRTCKQRNNNEELPQDLECAFDPPNYDKDDCALRNKDTGEKISNDNSCVYEKYGSGTKINQESIQKSIARNIVKTVLNSMMKNSGNIDLTSTTKITVVSDRIIFFSFLFNVISIVLTYTLFKHFYEKQNIKIAFFIYFFIIIISFILLYLTKN